METGDNSKYRKYCKCRNKVKAITRETQCQYEEHIALKAHTEPTNFWKYANSKLKTKSNIPDLFVNANKNLLTKTDGEKVEVLSDFFLSVFTRPSNDVQPTFDNKYIPYLMEPLNIDSKMVEKLLLNLKPSKSPGPDGIHRPKGACCRSSCTTHSNVQIITCFRNLKKILQITVW